MIDHEYLGKKITNGPSEAIKRLLQQSNDLSSDRTHLSQVGNFFQAPVAKLDLEDAPWVSLLRFLEL